MAIIYPDEEKLLETLPTVNAELKLEPELYIYLQKLAKEQETSIDNILNKIIREKAENSFVQKIEYVPIPYINPIDTEPYIDTDPRPFEVWYGSINSCTNDKINYTTSKTNEY